MIEDWLWLIALIIFVIMILVHYDWEYFFSQRQIKKLKKLQNLLNENNSLEKTAEAWMPTRPKPPSRLR